MLLAQKSNSLSRIARLYHSTVGVAVLILPINKKRIASWILVDSFFSKYFKTQADLKKKVCVCNNDSSCRCTNSCRLFVVYLEAKLTQKPWKRPQIPVVELHTDAFFASIQFHSSVRLINPTEGALALPSAPSGKDSWMWLTLTSHKELCNSSCIEKERDSIQKYYRIFMDSTKMWGISLDTFPFGGKGFPYIFKEFLNWR